MGKKQQSYMALLNHMNLFLELDQSKINESSVTPLRSSLKALYDHVYMRAPAQCGPIERLIVENLEADQIWAELCYLNEPLGKFLTKSVKRATRSEVRFGAFEQEQEQEGGMEESESD